MFWTQLISPPVLLGLRMLLEQICEISLSEAEELILNAELWDELEPYVDESIDFVNTNCLSLRDENEYLASILAWETAAVLPIFRWFAPELRMPHADLLSDEQVTQYLSEIIEGLFEKKIVLDFTDHLSDRKLYDLIYSDILPMREKKIENRKNFIHFDCSFAHDDPSVWLQYYASDEERYAWEDSHILPPPPKMLPSHARDIPFVPL